MDESEIRKLAQRNFHNFVKTLQRLLITEKSQFDLIVGSGSTGMFMTKLTQMVYDKLKVPIPPILEIPILRYRGDEKAENLFDNIVLYPDVSNWLQSNDINALSKVLFVDDEIYAGHLVKESMKLLVRHKKENNLPEPIVCTIVAEDQGIDQSFSIPDVEVDLQLFAEGLEGASNVITYILPDELTKPIKESLGDSVKNHWIINILLGLPVREKELVNSKPNFTTKYIKQVEETIPEFKDLQTETINYLNNLIEESLGM